MQQPRRLENVDYDAFGEEVFALRDEIHAKLGKEDLAHLWRMIWLNRMFTFIGYATAWIPNPISIYCLSQGVFGRWLITHHVSHGGYDAVPNVPERFKSKVFGRGHRRWRDWFDWIIPEAWHHEHNILHHCHTSEVKDPDLVEDLSEFLRSSGLPKPLKYVIIFLAGITWKFSYYAPNTLQTMDHNGVEPTTSLWHAVWCNGLDLRVSRVRRLWLSCYFPYATVTFILIPLAFLPFGKWVVLSVLINRLLAEFLTNFHSFLVIAPNHAGEDLYRFDYRYKGRGEFAVNQVISSCNYHCGSPIGDYLQIWLNYQIEHHIFPRLPMIRYRECQPVVKEICERHGVPYVQEPVWKRFWRMVQIMVGDTSMQWLCEAEIQQMVPPAVATCPSASEDAGTHGKAA